MTRDRKHIGVEIRWLVRKELPDVMEIEKLCFEFPWSEADVVDFLRERDGIGMVAEVDGEVVGFMLYRLRPRNIHLESFAVHPKHRRNGIGYAMIDRLVGKLSQQKRRSITLEVRESNLGAQLFLRDMGFKYIDKVPARYLETDEDSYIFRYALNEEEPTIFPLNRIRKFLEGGEEP